VEIVRVDEIGELAAAMASGEWKRRRKIALVANILTNVLNERPKTHPKRNQACQPKHSSQTNKCLLSYAVDRYGEKGLLQVSQWELRMPLHCWRGRISQSSGAAVPNTLKAQAEQGWSVILVK
jgi:hypothetical protein